MARREGSIQKLSNGKFKLVVNLPPDDTGKRKRLTKRVKGTKREAEAVLRLLESEKESLVKGKETFKSFLNIFLRDFAPTNCNERTLEGYRDLADGHLIPYFGRMRLNKIRAEDIQRYYSEKSLNGRRDGRGGLSSTSLNHHHTLIGRVIKKAYQMRKISVNIMDFVERPKISTPPISYLSFDEVENLIMESSKTRYLPLIMLATSSGMRRSELLGLKWKNVDLERMSISVEQVLYTLRGGRQVFSQPKSKSSRRRIDLDRFNVDMLKTLRNSTRDRLGESFSNETTVFSDLDGKPWKSSGVSQGVKALLTKIGRPDVHLHGLRHTTASNLLSLGVHMKIVQEILGHSDFGLTANTYSHVGAGLQTEAINKLAEARQTQKVSAPFRHLSENSQTKGIAI